MQQRGAQRANRARRSVRDRMGEVKGKELAYKLGSRISDFVFDGLKLPIECGRKFSNIFACITSEVSCIVRVHPRKWSGIPV